MHVYRLVTAGSVEECIVQRAQRKLFLDGMVNRGSTAQAKYEAEQQQLQVRYVYCSCLFVKVTACTLYQLKTMSGLMHIKRVLPKFFFVLFPGEEQVYSERYQWCQQAQAHRLRW